MSAEPARASEVVVSGSDRGDSLGRSRAFLAQEVSQSGPWRTRPRPPENGRFRELRFSSDGRYALAQDDDGVSVLTVQPFGVVYHVRASNVSFVGFSSDSNEIWVVVDPEHAVHKVRLLTRTSIHLERWSNLERSRVISHDLPASKCGSLAFSPEGDTFVCVDDEGSLRVYDVSSQDPLFEKRGFGKVFLVYQEDTSPSITTSGDPGSATIDFSPDGKYFIASPLHARGTAVAFDVRARTIVKLRGALRGRPGWFAFVAPNRVLISNWVSEERPVSARYVNFPGGETLDRPRIPPGILHRLTDQHFVLIRPFGKGTYDSDRFQRSAAVELRTGQMVISDSPALDVLGSLYIAELANGDLGLYEIGKGLKAAVRILSE